MEVGRPEPPPTLTQEEVDGLFKARTPILRSHPGLRDRQRQLLTSTAAALDWLRLEMGRYHDDSPKTRTGLATEWYQCRQATEALLASASALLATLKEEEGED